MRKKEVVVVAKRHGLSRRGSRRMFSQGALSYHPKNRLSGGSYAMRGGIRL